MSSNPWAIDVMGSNRPLPIKQSVKLKMSQAIVDNQEKIVQKINDINQDGVDKVLITICYDGQAMFCLNWFNRLFFFDGVNHIKVEKTDVLFQADYLTDGYNLFYIEAHEDSHQYVVMDLMEGSTQAGDINLREMDIVIHRFLCNRFMPFDAVVVEQES